jgi:hypothetical protein
MFSGTLRQRKIRNQFGIFAGSSSVVKEHNSSGSLPVGRQTQVRLVMALSSEDWFLSSAIRIVKERFSVF